MRDVPLVKYLNSGFGLSSGMVLLYQHVDHPANGNKKRVTFKRWTNTGICVEEFPGTIYPGNLWIEVINNIVIN